MTIYLDVLIALNLYINYFLIRSTAVMLHRRLSSKRAVISACAGAVFSLVILMPQLPFILSVLIRMLSGAAVTVTAFGWRRTVDFIVDILCFMVVSFVYAGLMLALWVFAAPLGMFYRNGMAYFDIPILAVALFTALSYGIMRLVRYLSDRRHIGTELKDVEISLSGITVQLKAMPDTGNSLCDPFSGMPVIICGRNDIGKILPDNIRAYLDGSIDDIDSLRLIPCITVGGNALIPAFRADSIIIDSKSVTAMVGVSCHELGAQCIFNPKLISI